MFKLPTKKSFRRENLLLGTAMVTFVSTFCVVLFSIISPSISVVDHDLIVTALLGASSAWAGIGSYHRVTRQAQRTEQEQFAELADPGDSEDDFGGERE